MFNLIHEKNENTASVREEVTMQLTVKCSYAKISSSVSHLYFCTGELCTGCNRKHSSFAFLSTELKLKVFVKLFL